MHFRLKVTKTIGMILKIKNMKSIRCKILVEEEMHKLGFQNITVELGEVEFVGDISDKKLQLFDSALRDMGLEILVDKRNLLVAQIKDAIYELVYLTDDLPKPNNSDYISEKVNMSYNSLAKTFSEIENITIERYIIIQRIERVKELLVYSDTSLSTLLLKCTSAAWRIYPISLKKLPA